MPATPKSEWLQKFVAGVQAPMTWANLDEYESVGVLPLLKGAERTEAEDLLVERARHARGDSPAELELTWRADDEHEPLRTFAASMQTSVPPWHDDFPLQTLAARTGYARTWAEDCLWHFLPDDPRAARAFASLGVTRAVGPLREVLQSATGAVATRSQPHSTSSATRLRKRGAGGAGVRR